MKINKNQALYKALPGSWIEYSKSNKNDYKYASRVIAWNTKKLEGIYSEKLCNDIKRRINSFARAGGNISDFSLENLNDKFEFCEASIQEEIPDVYCEINPRLFYCPRCGEVKYINNSITSAPSCKTCNLQMSQLQFVYACECGYAEGVKPPFAGNYIYRPTANRYQLLKIENKIQRPIELRIKCPICSSTIYPKNATDKIIFTPHNGKNVNLFNKKFGDILKAEGANAEKLMLAKWLSLISTENFVKILNKPDEFFHPAQTIDEEDPFIKRMISLLGREAVLEQFNASANENTILSVINRIPELISYEDFSNDELEIIISDLIEYDTLNQK